MNRRPFGVSVLAVLQIAAGIWIGIQGFFLYELAGRFATQNRLPWPLVSATVPIGSIVILSLWLLIAGLMLWYGQPWGWWLSAVYRVYHFLETVIRLNLVEAVHGQWSMVHSKREVVYVLWTVDNGLLRSLCNQVDGALGEQESCSDERGMLE